MEKAFVTTDARILGGKPIIAGTRIAVATILDMLAADMAINEVIEEYPELSKEQIQVAISFAARRVATEEIFPIVEKNGRLVFPTV